ncbi:MAG: hypothetical protein COV36_06445 [Alphaproteobacteria bacterium CG11_big_fil_rev_8_21_14_0_20_44_7]|nr:MAG: hypothetical protein COV36_06445 [Alphaproteobacteria bacterium CG11_big_fil_rev_8_21_14_0_20_44_7]
MIHHKDFPFDKRAEENEFIHMRGGTVLDRGMKIKIVILSLAFASLMFGAKYLYDLGRGTTNPLDAPLIQASNDSFREKPEDPGGMVIPHLDKEIYENFGSSYLEDKQEVFTIDAPEKPIDIDPLGELIDSYEKPSSKIESKIAPETKPSDTEKKVEQKPRSIKIDKDGNVQTSSLNNRYKASSTSKRIDVEKVLATQDLPKVWVQLGTFESEETASKAWQDVSEKNKDVLKDISLSIVKSDLGDKGVFYRLRSEPLTSEGEAKEICKKLNERQQNCFFVKDQSETSEKND